MTLVSAARRRRVVSLGAVLAIAALVVAALVVASSSGGGSGTKAPSGAVSGAGAARALFAGVPQRGAVLGDSKAPVRVVEFADLQCPFCRAYSLDVMPGLVQRYVRAGKVRMEFRNLAFIGPDSERMARLAEAAGLQDKLWNVVDLLYANQGRENTGYATDAFLRRVAGAVPGLDVNRAFADGNSARVTAALQVEDTAATRAGVRSTPTFLVGRGTALTAVGAAGLPAAIEAAVAR